MSIQKAFNPLGAQHGELYEFLAWARREEPVFFWEEQGCWVVTKHDDAATVLGDGEHFSVHGILGAMNDQYCEAANQILSEGIDWNRVHHIQNVEGTEHARMRTILQRILTPKRFRQMEPFVRSLVGQLIDGFIDEGKCEFVEQFAYPLPILTIFNVIGFNEEEEDMRQLQIWSDDLFKMWLVPMPAEDQVKCAQHAVDYQNYMKAKIAERRKVPKNDLMTEMLKEVDSDGDNRLTDEELVLIFTMNLIGAGHETTKSALSNAVYQLLRERRRWESLKSDPDNAPKFVEESLRYDSSVLAWYRTVEKEIELGGKRMKAGERVVVLLGSANHDESKFEEPESFCPFKEDRGRHMAFSHGRHFCLGAPLARLEMKVALQELALRLPTLDLAPGYQPEYEPSVATRSLSRLDLQWK